MSAALPVRTSRVLANQAVSPTAFCLTLERTGLEFRAGELVSLHGRDRLDARDYTIASGERDPCLRVLVRLIPHGALTPQLAALRPGDPLELTGPYGTFTVRDPERPLVFVATGTGIAPALAFRRSHPDLNLTVLHGVARRDSSGATVALESGVAARLPNGAGVEGPCLIQFRSGAVLIDPPGQQDGLQLAGRITQASYPGGTYRYEIETPVGRFFVDDARRAMPGDAVQITIPAEEMHVFPHAGA